MEIHLVNKNVSAFPGESLWVTGEGTDPCAVAEADDESRYTVFLVNDFDIGSIQTGNGFHFLRQSAGDLIGFPRPHSNIVGDEFLCGEFIP